MVKVFVHKITPRVSYVFDYIFNQILKTPYTLVLFTGDKGVSPNDKRILFYLTDFSGFEHFEGLKIKSSGYLNSEDIQHPRLPSSCPHFDLVGNSIIEEDILSLLFYILTRAEEYLPSVQLDKYGRYLASNSILSNWGVLDKPIVDIWLNKIAVFFDVNISTNYPYKAIPTIDVDTGYKHLYKGFVRSVGGLVKLFFKDFRIFFERSMVLLRFNKDPFDIYTSLLPKLKTYYPELVVFVLNAKRGRFDSGLPIGGGGIKKIVSALQKCAISIGIHPSYASNTNEAVFKAEIENLRNLTTNVPCSRQHFLKLHLPESYYRLTEVGINHDYSMAYPDTIGFRAGTCRPFVFFDVQQNVGLDLTVHSAAFMDGYFFQYAQVDREQALTTVIKFKETVEEIGGDFISIWHESTVAPSSSWSALFNTLYPCK